MQTLKAFSLSLASSLTLMLGSSNIKITTTFLSNSPYLFLKITFKAISICTFSKQHKTVHSIFIILISTLVKTYDNVSLYKQLINYVMTYKNVKLFTKISCGYRLNETSIPISYMFLNVLLRFKQRRSKKKLCGSCRFFKHLYSVNMIVISKVQV